MKTRDLYSISGLKAELNDRQVFDNLQFVESSLRT